MHSVWRIEGEDLVELEDLGPVLANALVDGLCQHLQEVIHLLVAHDVRCTIFLLDRPIVVPIDKFSGEFVSTHDASLFGLHHGLFVHGEKPDLRSFGDLYKVGLE